jgi:hypothetical protein
LDPVLAKLTDAYIRSEEARLEKNLSSVGYSVDSPATVSLITGAGRFERVRHNPVLNQSILKAISVYLPFT